MFFHLLVKNLVVLTGCSYQASGKAEVSFVSKLLDENDETEGGQEGEEVIRDAAMSIYGGAFLVYP